MDHGRPGSVGLAGIVLNPEERSAAALNAGQIDAERGQHPVVGSVVNRVGRIEPDQAEQKVGIGGGDGLAQLRRKLAQLALAVAVKGLSLERDGMSGRKGFDKGRAVALDTALHLAADGGAWGFGADEDGQREESQSEDDGRGAGGPTPARERLPAARRMGLRTSAPAGFGRDAGPDGARVHGQG